MEMKTQISIFYSESTPLTRDVACSKVYRDGKNKTDQKLSFDHTQNV